MALPDLSPSSSSTSSPRLVHSNSGSSEWNMMQKKIRSSLLLLLVLSTIFLFSILYSSHSFSAVTAKEALTQSPLLTALDMSHLMPAEEADDQTPEAAGESSRPANSSLTSASSTPEVDGSSSTGVSLPSADSAASVPTQSPAEETIPTGEVGIAVEEKCDMSTGKWVKEPRGPIYTNMTCPTLPDFKNCQKYGKEPSYLYWRWQPDRCELPRFAPERFLDVVRGKKLAFIGDSLARNQMESLLCLLSQAETPTDIYSDPFDKFRTWYFPEHNFTLMVMWTEFYVQGVPIFFNGTATASFDIHLDRLNTNWTAHLPELDYAVISGGNWFFRINYLWEDGERIGCVNCREENVTDFGIPYAIQRVVRKALETISQCRQCDRLVTFLRTYTPSHFENGSWFNGGYCNRTQPLEESELSLSSIEWELRRIQSEEVKRVREVSGNKRFGVLDVTKAMMQRVDGHPGENYDKRWVRNANDCLHWCLPGPVDMWNDILLQRLAEISPVR